MKIGLIPVNVGVQTPEAIVETCHAWGGRLDGLVHNAGMSVIKPLVGVASDGPSDAAVLQPLPESRRSLRLWFRS